MAVFAEGETKPVESVNTVGFQEQALDGEYRVIPVQFKGIGSGEKAFNINEVIDTSLVADYSDELQIYDPEVGFVTYLWDCENWIGSLDDKPLDITAVPGAAFMAFGDTWRFAGEVPAMDEFEIAIVPGTYNLIGGALPIDATLANFDWTNVADYSDELQIYDPEVGFVTYLWDCENWIGSLDDKPIAITTPMNDGFLFFSDLEGITESITPFYSSEE